MIKAIGIAVVLLIAVCLGLQLQHDPGYLLIELNHWSLETTAWFAIIALLLAFLLLHTVLLLIRRIMHIPTRWRRFRVHHRTVVAQNKTSQGFIAFSEGNWLRAEAQFRDALPYSDTPVINYLMMARAANALGKYQERNHYLHQAQQATPKARIAIQLTQAMLQLNNAQWDDALATLKPLQQSTPNHPYVLNLSMELYQHKKDWHALMHLLPRLKRQHILTDAHYQALEESVFNERQHDLIQKNQRNCLDHFMRSLPTSLPYHAALLARYCHYLLTLSKTERGSVPDADQIKVEQLLRRALRRQFNEQLIEVYGQLPAKCSKLAFAESFIPTQPNSAALFLCVARISERNQLWGKATTYFETSIRLHATPTAYTEWGQLLEQHLHDPMAACAAYKQGLLLV